MQWLDDAGRNVKAISLRPTSAWAYWQLYAHQCLSSLLLWRYLHENSRHHPHVRCIAYSRVVYVHSICCLKPDHGIPWSPQLYLFS